MQGVAKTVPNRTVVGFAVPRAVNGQPAPQPKQGSNFYDNETYPIPVAAQGPDWEVGRSWSPDIHNSGLVDGYYTVTAANYGQTGSMSRTANDGVLTDPREAGRTEFATNKIRSIRWDPDALPTFDPRLPAWNVLPPGTYYRGQTPSLKRSNTFTASAGKQNIAGPLNFSTPGAASLVQAGLAGS